MCDDPHASSPLDGWRRSVAVALVTALIALFAATFLMLTLLILIGCNGIAFIVLYVRHSPSAKLAFLTAALMFVSLILTDWGFSTPHPRIRVAWVALVPAGIAQIALISRLLQPT